MNKLKEWWNQQHHNRKSEIIENAKIAAQWLTMFGVILLIFVFIGSGFDG